MADWDLTTAVAAFNDVATGQNTWSSALEQLAQATNSFGAAIFSVTGEPGPTAHTQSMADPLKVYVRDGWALKDRRYLAADAMLAGNVVTEFDFTTPDLMQRDPYYQDFLQPLGLQWFAGLGIAFGETLWSVSLQRTIGQGPFSAAEQDTLWRLSKKLSSAGAMSSALMGATQSGALAAFELSHRAVIVFDKWGLVAALNPSAERKLGDGIDIVKRQIRSVVPDVTEQLRRAIFETIWSDDPLASPTFIVLPRLNARPLLAHLIKSAAGTLDVQDAGCILTLVDPDEKLEQKSEMLITWFGLSRAEARLALKLQSGLDLAQSAHDLGRSPETVRTQLRGIFAKLGVSRQQDLIAVLATVGARI